MAGWTPAGLGEDASRVAHGRDPGVRWLGINHLTCSSPRSGVAAIWCGRTGFLSRGTADCGVSRMRLQGVAVEISRPINRGQAGENLNLSSIYGVTRSIISTARRGDPGLEFFDCCFPGWLLARSGYWGTNSVGRVRPLQGRSQGFESPVLHDGWRGWVLCKAVFVEQDCGQPIGMIRVISYQAPYSVLASLRYFAGISSPSVAGGR